MRMAHIPCKPDFNLCVCVCLLIEGFSLCVSVLTNVEHDQTDRM